MCRDWRLANTIDIVGRVTPDFNDNTPISDINIKSDCIYKSLTIATIV